MTQTVVTLSPSDTFWTHPYPAQALTLDWVVVTGGGGGGLLGGGGGGSCSGIASSVVTGDVNVIVGGGGVGSAFGGRSTWDYGNSNVPYAYGGTPGNYNGYGATGGIGDFTIAGGNGSPGGGVGAGGGGGGPASPGENALESTPGAGGDNGGYDAATRGGDGGEPSSNGNAPGGGAGAGGIGGDGQIAVAYTLAAAGISTLTVDNPTPQADSTASVTLPGSTGFSGSVIEVAQITLSGNPIPTLTLDGDATGLASLSGPSGDFGESWDLILVAGGGTLGDILAPGNYDIILEADGAGFFIQTLTLTVPPSNHPRKNLTLLGVG